MELKKYKLGDIATIEISSVDKKNNEKEMAVKLCNFVDVYYNWAITKDSETRDDIGIPTYIAEDFENVILGYHNVLVTPNEGTLNGKYLNALLHTDYAKKFKAVKL